MRFGKTAITSALLTWGLVFSVVPHEALAARAPSCTANNLATTVARVIPAVVVIHTTVLEGTKQGSGFIFNPNGYILTNAHVVLDAVSLTVTLHNGASVEGEIIFADEENDVAVIKILADNLPIVKMGDSSKIRAGDPVFAIGAPYGLDNTVTAGVISNKLRDVSKPMGYIQTDVSINPGNSGGPLFNDEGLVIGINTMILSPNGGGSIGLSFAIPINDALTIMAQAMKK